MVFFFFENECFNQACLSHIILQFTKQINIMIQTVLRNTANREVIQNKLSTSMVFPLESTIFKATDENI